MSGRRVVLQASRVNCSRCPALCRSRKSIVDGQGPTAAPLMVVDAWPGRDEDRASMPQLGEGGRLLRATVAEAMARHGIDPTRVFYTYALRCKPAYGHEVTQEELEACVPWLLAELEAVNPSVILALGHVAEGQVTEAVMVWGMPPELTLLKAYSPNYILKNRSKLAAWTEQVELAVRRAFGIPALPHVVETAQTWEFGQPDMTSKWLSADTEFDTLEEDGYGQRMVGFSLSDGERSDFYPVPDVDKIPRLPRVRAGVEQRTLVVSASSCVDAGEWLHPERPECDACMRQPTVLQSSTPIVGDTDTESSGHEIAGTWTGCSGDTEQPMEADSRSGDDGSQQSTDVGARSREALRLLASRRSHGPIYVHNAKADLVNLGIDPDDLGAYEDTMLMAYVTRRFPRVGLKVLGPQLTGLEW